MERYSVGNSWLIQPLCKLHLAVATSGVVAMANLVYYKTLALVAGLETTRY